MPIYRFVFDVYPMWSHPTYFEWQTARAVVFIRETFKNEEAGLINAYAKLKHEQWNVLKHEHSDVLIEDRVREVGGDVWRGYQEAEATGSFLKIFVDGIFGNKQAPMLPRVPRITEKFIDEIIERAGGRRLSPDESNNELTPNADYLLYDRVWELKILEEEGLDKDTRQAKLAEIFRRPVGPFSTIQLDPQNLSEENRRRYIDIVGGPIQTAIKKASKQIGSTKRHLQRSDLRGGVIVVNTGYGTLHPDMLLPIAQRYAKKDTSEVKDVIAISTWVQPGKAFDGTVFFQCQPEGSGDVVIEKFSAIFWEHVQRFMTDFMLSGMRVTETALDPARPVTFERYGIFFAARQLKQSGEGGKR